MLSDKPFEVPTYLMERAAGMTQRTMAVAGADHPTALESARQAAEAGLVEPILVGDRSVIDTIAADVGWNIANVRVVNADGEKQAAETAVALAKCGEAQSLMKGQMHTDALMRAVVQRDTGLRTGRRLSHIFHMTVPGSDRVLHITDAAINVAPDLGTRIDIINNAVSLAKALGKETPKVALLSATETPIDAMPSSREAAEIVRRAANGEVDDAHVDGPFAFDNAVSPIAATMKGIDSPVAGDADILLVPNIETGNALFKMMVHFMSGVAAGVVMGASVPIVLTSRADPPEARLAAAAVAAIAAEDAS